MRRAALWIGLPIALWATPCPAAEGGIPGIPDAAGGEGVLHGRIVHAERPEARANRPVVLYAISNEGTPAMRSAISDAAGGFRFENLSSDPDTAYLVGAQFAGVTFSHPVRFAEGERERRVVIEISDPSPDAAPVAVGELRLRLDPGCGRVRVSETHQLRNPTHRVIHVPESERAKRPPLLRTPLPPAAEGFEPTFGRFQEGVEREGDEVRFWGPLFPGSGAIEFAYSVPETGEGFALRRDFPRGSTRVAVLAPAHAPPPRFSGVALRSADPVVREGRPYRVLEAGPLAPGARLELALPRPAGGVPEAALSIDRVQISLELDGAALTADEQLDLTVEGDAPLASSSGEPLLCLELPPGAEGLQLSPATLALGPSAEPGGVLAIRGPIPSGSSALGLRYRVPVEADTAVLERRFPREVALLSIFVADTGLIVESDRLHRRRPFRTSSRSYLQLEGFGIRPEEGVALRLTPLPPRPPASPALAAGFVLLAAVGAGAFLVAPLRSGRAELPAETQHSSAQDEREALYAAIRDLDDDLETGKLTEGDHAALRAELRARAVALLREEREAAGRSRPDAARPPSSCPECGASPRPDDRFCSRCGARLGTRGGDGSPV